MQEYERIHIDLKRNSTRFEKYTANQLRPSTVNFDYIVIQNTY